MLQKRTYLEAATFYDKMKNINKIYSYLSRI